MDLAGSAVIGASRDLVWAALRDPAVLVHTIPGCERLEETGPDTYRMTINAGVGSLRGVYQGEVALADPLEPESFTLKARGQGAPGTVDATVRVRLSGADGGTRVDYDAEAVVGGMIGGVGQRMLTSVAKRTAGEFFAAVEEHLRAPAEAALPSGLGLPAETAVPAEPAALVGEAADRAGEVRGAVYERPAPRHTETRPWVMLASFGMGAGVALTGVAIGWLFGRTSRRH
ncbi:carbon monoxide dehydrogenase [Nonomuraea terrae]|uniref:Carbon monoxide dehydrogenase n=1 Tax=Nonomuraea terrae TaxID=2530383 RepID=A0A4V2YL37_9ACTN|nr:carbon monoxide dehydrogenase subunit G [Nonomuraea terrae]TDD45237.1 carbon monoxide dehydrogenase [Nonomuraea terrae]